MHGACAGAEQGVWLWTKVGACIVEGMRMCGHAQVWTDRGEVEASEA